MARFIKKHSSPFLRIGYLLLLSQILSYSDKCQAVTFDREEFSRDREFLVDFPWLLEDADYGDVENNTILFRERRETNGTNESKSVWDKIKEFYSDKNNMAMFCVLPIMVLIYGGCSSIYCIYKCRQYLRRRKHKRLREEEEEEDSTNTGKTDLNTEVNGGKERPISRISSAWTDLQVGTGGQRWSGQTEGRPLGDSSPLPWHVPGQATPAAAEELSQTECRDNRSRAGYLDDALRKDDIGLKDGRLNQPSPMDKRLGGRKMFEDSFDSDQKADNQHQGTHLPGALLLRTADVQPFEKTRAHANLADYAMNRSSTLKATDYSRFSDSRPIEIIPLSADPNLRVWDPLHNRPLGEKGRAREQRELSDGCLEEPQRKAPGNSRQGAQAMKEELMARYDVMSTLQMAKKAAEILNASHTEKSNLQRKQAKKKHIFVAE